MVAPVRATCAQVLGVVSHLMTEENIAQMTKVLLLLVSESQWEVRHASLMGIQHLLAARTVREVCHRVHSFGHLFSFFNPFIIFFLSLCAFISF